MKEALVAEAIAGFQAAAMDELRWTAAVERLAAATDSRSGELIGLGADCLVPFNLMTGADPVAGQPQSGAARKPGLRPVARILPNGRPDLGRGLLQVDRQ